MADDQREALWALRQNPEMPQTSKEKQEAYRARMMMLGLKEVRGIYAPEYLQSVIKDFVRKWVDERLREDERKEKE